MYCPKCKSRLYPGDTDYMNAVGICSSCVCYDNTPGKRYQAAYDAYMKNKKKLKKQRNNRRLLMLYT